MRSFKEMEVLWKGFNEQKAQQQLYFSVHDGWEDKFVTPKDAEIYAELFDKNNLAQKWWGSCIGTLDGGETYNLINPRKGWIAGQGNIDDLFELIIEGAATTGHMTGGERCMANFEKINVALVDIDDTTTVSLDNIEDHEFYKKYCAGYYTTPSHKTDDHRFRLIFVLDRVITKETDIRAIYTALIHIFGGDGNCKDGSRIFFGSKGAHHKIIHDKVIPNDIIDILIEEGTEEVEEYIAPENITFDDGDKEQLLNLLRNASVNEYDAWWKMVSAMITAGYDYNDLCYVSAGNPNHSSGSFKNKSAVNMKSYWSSFNSPSARKISPGYLWNLVGGKPKQAKVERNDKLAAVIKALPHREKEMVVFDESARMHEYSSKYTEEFPLTDGDIFIKSPKGSGKTHQLEKAVQQCKDRGLSCLVVGHRVTLLAGMAMRLGLTNYKTINWDAVTDAETKYLAICINSIEKLEGKTYDVVILDESEQVLQHFVGQTIKPKRRKKISKLVYDLVNGAKTVICLDADLSDLTVNFIAMVRGNKTTEPIAHRNNYTVEDEEINMWENKSNMMDDIEKSINAGKSVFVATNSKNWVNYFSDYLTSNKIKHTAITQDNSDEEKVGKYLHWVGNTDAVRKNEILLASPTLGTGVDIQAPFDVVYGIFETKPTTHYDFDQQISRVRNATEINIWVASQRYGECSDWHIIKNNLLTNDAETRELIDYNLKDVDEPWFNMVLDLYSMIVANRAKSMNQLRENFENMKKEQGYTINHIAHVNKKRASTDLKQMRAERLAQLKTDLQCVKPLSYDEYSEIYLRKRKSVEQKNSVLRYEIEDFFKEDVNNNVEIVDWYIGDKRRLLRAYEQFSLPVEMLHALDRGSMDNHPIDRKNLSLKVETLKKGLEILGLWKNGEYNFSQVILKGNDNVNELIQWGVDNGDHIQQTIKLKMDGTQMLDKPIDVIKSFTRKAGLEIVKVGKERVGTSKTYVGIYQLDNGHQKWLIEWSGNRQKSSKNGVFA